MPRLPPQKANRKANRRAERQELSQRRLTRYLGEPLASGNRNVMLADQSTDYAPAQGSQDALTQELESMMGASGTNEAT